MLYLSCRATSDAALMASSKLQPRLLLTRITCRAKKRATSTALQDTERLCWQLRPSLRQLQVCMDGMLSSQRLLKRLVQLKLVWDTRHVYASALAIKTLSLGAGHAAEHVH